MQAGSLALVPGGTEDLRFKVISWEIFFISVKVKIDLSDEHASNDVSATTRTHPSTPRCLGV